MLVLSRRPDEDIVIGDRIVVRVIRVDGERVILGVDAPREVPVHRGEVWEAINGDGGRNDGGEHPATHG